jgi:hypothetical protein
LFRIVWRVPIVVARPRYGAVRVGTAFNTAAATAASPLGFTQWGCFVIVLRVALIVLLAASPVAAQVRVEFSGHITGIAGNAVAFNDFLTVFGLQAQPTGPNGAPEIPFTGSFSFIAAQSNALCEEDDGFCENIQHARYLLSHFAINGVSVAPHASTSELQIKVVLFPGSGSAFQRDTYEIAISNVFPVTGNGPVRVLSTSLQVDVPVGLLALAVFTPPINVDAIYEEGLSFRGTPDFSYQVQTGPGTFAGLLGDTVWDSAMQPYDPEISLVDPVFDLLSSRGVLSEEEICDRAAEGKTGRPVHGVAADGVALLVIRIRARSADEVFSLALSSGAVDDGGGLGRIGSDANSTTTTLTARDAATVRHSRSVSTAHRPTSHGSTARATSGTGSCRRGRWCSPRNQPRAMKVSATSSLSDHP